MKSSQNSKETLDDSLKERIKSLPLYLKGFFGIFIVLTIYFIIVRILLFYTHFDTPLINFEKDTDLRIQYELMKGGLENFYSTSNYYEDDIGRWVSVYLYYWYFIFYPIQLIPMDIMVFIYDFLRLIIGIYVLMKVYEMANEKKNFKWFLFVYSVGFWYDGFLNNFNFLLQFLLLESYLYIDKNKWIAGILFTLGMVKINVFLFLIGLLVIKKIRVKDAFYFLIPLLIACLPYIIFPNFLFQMISNWLLIEEYVPESTWHNPLLISLHFIWQGFQPAHLLHLGIVSFVIFENAKNQVKARRIVIITTFSYFIVISIYITILAMIG